MKREEEKENKKRINSEVINFQVMSPNVLATYYLRKADNKAFTKEYEESAKLYEQAIDCFKVAISINIAISKNNYTHAICNLAMLYNNGYYEEAVKVIFVPQNLQKYINAEILTNTQKSLYYNIGCYHIKDGNLVIACAT